MIHLIEITPQAAEQLNERYGEHGFHVPPGEYTGDNIGGVLIRHGLPENLVRLATFIAKEYGSKNTLYLPSRELPQILGPPTGPIQPPLLDRGTMASLYDGSSHLKPNGKKK
jgi:hypothetical protein